MESVSDSMEYSCYLSGRKDIFISCPFMVSIVMEGLTVFQYFTKPVTSHFPVLSLEGKRGEIVRCSPSWQSAMVLYRVKAHPVTKPS